MAKKGDNDCNNIATIIIEIAIIIFFP